MNTKYFKQASWICFAATIGNWLLPLVDNLFAVSEWIPILRAVAVAVVYCIGFVAYTKTDKRFWICVILYLASTGLIVTRTAIGMEEIESLMEVIANLAHYFFAIILCFCLKENTKDKAQKSAENTMWAYSLGLVLFLCGTLFRTALFSAIGVIVLFVCEFFLVRVFYRCAKS